MNAPDNTERYYVDVFGTDDDAVSMAFDWTLRMAEDNGYSRVAVLVHGPTQIEFLGRALGDPGAPRLMRDRQMQIGGVQVELYAKDGEPTWPTTYRAGPVLAVWFPEDDLDRADAIGAPVLCVVPWGSINGWKTAWDPTEIRTSERQRRPRRSLTTRWWRRRS